MSGDFRIEFDWLGKDDTSLDEATWAEISLIVDGVVLTELQDTRARTVRSGVRASAYHFAYWLAENWWRLRWEPENDSFGDVVLPVTDAHTARQKFQRAFAAELLCPFDEVRASIGNWTRSMQENIPDERIEKIADRYDVSPLLVMTQLANKEIVEREMIRFYHE
ncbi:MAG TPA: hypothetical protein VMO47_11720 [Rhodothermales bacterium]|nr:hypothetical protein [Rhodothermales bacterium]